MGSRFFLIEDCLHLHWEMMSKVFWLIIDHEIMHYVYRREM